MFLYDLIELILQIYIALTSISLSTILVRGMVSLALFSLIAFCSTTLASSTLPFCSSHRGDSSIILQTFLYDFNTHTCSNFNIEKSGDHIDFISIVMFPVFYNQDEKYLSGSYLLFLSLYSQGEGDEEHYGGCTNQKEDIPLANEVTNPREYDGAGREWKTQQQSH